VPFLSRIVHAALVAALVLAVTGVATMASAAIGVPCCSDDGSEQHGPSPEDCSPFCVSCPSRTVAAAETTAECAVFVFVTSAPAPDITLSVPADPPRKGVFHPPRPSLSNRSR
jgi:hypothetical protein